MLIASKYEEMYAPEVRDFVFITAEAYTSAQIREKEKEMLKELDYNFGNPLCLHFLRRCSRAGDVRKIISVITLQCTCTKSRKYDSRLIIMNGCY